MRHGKIIHKVGKEPSSDEIIEMIKDVNYYINERHRKPNHEKRSRELGKSPTKIFIEKLP